MSPKDIRDRQGDHRQLRAAGGQSHKGLREDLQALLSAGRFLSLSEKEFREEERKEDGFITEQKYTQQAVRTPRALMHRPFLVVLF